MKPTVFIVRRISGSAGGARLLGRPDEINPHNNVLLSLFGRLEISESEIKRKLRLGDSRWTVSAGERRRSSTFRLGAHRRLWFHVQPQVSS